MQISASFQIITRSVGRLGLGSGSHIVGWLGSGSRVMEWLGSRVWVCASFPVLTAGGNALGGDGNYPVREMYRGNMSEEVLSYTQLFCHVIL